ncbi:MAG: hypothetical protein LW693_10120 [Saprospiraceae bacterium]|nr:hypothetical protein [Saprospiraceae bacterium]
MIQRFPLSFLFRSLIIPGFLLFQTQAFGQVVPKISFQGVLKTASGEPVPDGEYTFTFSFWKSLSSTANADKLLKIGATNFDIPDNQWAETVELGVAGGIYSHNLGSVTPLNPKNFEGPVYLNIKVGGKDILPRTEFTYAPFSFSVAKAQKVVCSGAVGDIKYSILPPDKFKDVNGDCWVPLDGRTLSNTDELYTLGVYTLPNAGGMFLRAQDFNAVPGTESWMPRNSSNNDPDRGLNSAIGMVQQDTVQAHKHTGKTNMDGEHQHKISSGIVIRGNENGPDEYTYANYGGNATSLTTDGGQGKGSHEHAFTTNETGSAETRPKNLNFWIYIRIN